MSETYNIAIFTDGDLASLADVIGNDLGAKPVRQGDAAVVEGKSCQDGRLHRRQKENGEEENQADFQWPIRGESMWSVFYANDHGYNKPLVSGNRLGLIA